MCQLQNPTILLFFKAASLLFPLSRFETRIFLPTFASPPSPSLRGRVGERPMKIHIFNPEHDLALASNLDNFTAPHAGRDLRHDLGFLPAIWAGRGERVLVDNREAAEYAYSKLGLPMRGVFITRHEFWNLGQSPLMTVEPWGWDRAIRKELLRYRGRADRLPDDTYLNIVRQSSHRSWAAEHLLRRLRQLPGTVGEAETAHSLAEIRRFLSVRHRIVLKAPWSSSGRGVRYISDDPDSTSTLTPQLEGWVEHTLRRQGAILMEPYYNKVMDFGMEWESDGQGDIRYCGLSLFNTVKGAYTGNILADEEEKEQRVAQFISPVLLSDVRQRIKELLTVSLVKFYHGPFGIDMMIVSQDGKLLLHPCVELNLRMTMGHVALRLREVATKPWNTMRVNYKNGKYCLEMK